MKKKVKGLIIAASVVAVAGIAAVSFAYWNAGGGGQQATAGNTGNTVTALDGISVTYGGENYTTVDNVISINDKLVPYDQDLKNETPGQAALITPEDENAGWVNVNYMVFTVSNGENQTRAGVTYKISGGLTAKTLEEGSTETTTPVGNAKLMYKVGDTTTKPTSTAGFTTMPATATAMKNFNSGDKVTVILVASGSDAKNVNWNITFSANDGPEVETAYKMTYNGVDAELNTVQASAGESVVYLAENVELTENTTLEFTIGGEKVTAIKGADDSDDTKAGKATVSNNVVTVPAAGTYNVYIKQKTGDTTNWYVWVEYPAPTDRDDATVANKAFLVGQFISEGDQQFYSDLGYAMTRDDKGAQWVITKELGVGDVVKFRKGNNWHGFSATNSASSWFTADDDGNMVVKEGMAGTYTFYLKDNPDNGTTYIYVTKA